MEFYIDSLNALQIYILYKKINLKKMLSFEPTLIENQESFQLIDQVMKQSKKTAEILSLSKDRLHNFIANLGDHRKSQIRKDALEHCQQLNKNRKIISSYISDQSVVKMAAHRIDKMLKNKKIKKNWSEDDVKILIWVLSKYADQLGIEDLEKDIGYKDWERISQLIPGVTANSCMFKWLSLKKINLSQSNWASEESELLRKVIEQKNVNKKTINLLNNVNWKIIAEQFYKQSINVNRVFRSAKQCRQHWNCFLNPHLRKGPWNIEEDIQLLKLIRTNNGDKKWAEIVCSFEGRTENALKNRFTLLLDKQRKISKSKQQLALIEDCLQKCMSQQSNKTQNNRSVFINQILQNNSSRQFPIKRQNSIESVDTLESPSINQMLKNDASSVSINQHQNNELRIHYLTANEQQEFLEWMRRRNDVKRCCLKNGAFEIQE